MNVRFTISAELDVPDTTHIGQTLTITGPITIDQLEAELIDVSNTERDQWTRGRITGRAYSNNLQVTA